MPPDDESLPETGDQAAHSDPDEEQPATDRRKRRRGAAVLAILFGGIGAHKFYLGRIGQGLLYLCFAWTTLPALVGIVEGIRFLRQSDEEFESAYSSDSLRSR